MISVWRDPPTERNPALGLRQWAEARRRGGREPVRPPPQALTSVEAPRVMGLASKKRPPPTAIGEGRVCGAGRPQLQGRPGPGHPLGTSKERPFVDYYRPSAPPRQGEGVLRSRRAGQGQGRGRGR
jgi:hypothetical protein